MNLIFKLLENKKPSFIIDSMVKGLENKHTEINMETFGKVQDYICYGCAATNAICEIFNIKFDENTIESRKKRFSEIYKHLNLNEIIDVNKSIEDLSYFENAINNLRIRYIEGYNKNMKKIFLDNLIIPEDIKTKYLPLLLNRNYKKNLTHYLNYSKTLKNEGL